MAEHRTLNSEQRTPNVGNARNCHRGLDSRLTDRFGFTIPLTPALSPGERVKLCRVFGSFSILRLYPAQEFPGVLRCSACFVETIVAGRGNAFSSFAFTGANDEKVGLLGSLPRVASASRTDPGLSSVALSGLGFETDVFYKECSAFNVPRSMFPPDYV
jgi:hypothetical protein